MGYWTRITKPKSGIQRDFFEASKEVYNYLFPFNIREPWENFEAYITDTEERREPETILDAEYFYYVALFNSEVCGMASFDIYKEDALGVISYIGICNRDDTKKKNHPSQYIVGKMVHELVNMSANIGSERCCNGFLFEVEHVDPKYLRKIPKDLIDLEKREIRRIRWISNLQNVYGARKIGWINYVQPKLVWEMPQQKHHAHLMFASLTPRINKSYVIDIDRKEVKRLVKFIYKIWYYEGYECTERVKHKSEMTERKRLKQWEYYLDDLYQESIKILPKNVTLQKIDLEAERQKVFISYPHKGVFPDVAEYTQQYLNEFDFKHVFFWNKDKGSLIGDRLNPTIYKKMKESKVFIVFLGKYTLSAKGQLKELKYIREHWSEKKVISLFLETDCRCKKFTSIERKLPKYKQRIYTEFTKENCHKVIEDIAGNLLKHQADMRSI